MIMLGILAAQRVLAAIVNLIANGNFAQAGAGWTSYVVGNGGSIATGTADVTFNGGTCQLLRTQAGRGFTYGMIGQALSGPPTRVGAVYKLSFDYSAPATPPFGAAILGGNVSLSNLSEASAHIVREVIASADDVAEFCLSLQAASNGTTVTVDNVIVELITSAPANFNYIAEGDFAGGKGSWFAGAEGGNGASVNNGEVTFDNGACQIRTIGDFDDSKDGYLQRNLKGQPSAGATYRVSFDQSFVGGAPTEGRYEVRLGGKSQAYTPKQGRVTVDVVTSTTTQVFQFFGSSYDGQPVTVDNISVTRV